MRSDWRRTVACGTWLLGVVAVGCQLLTGAHERRSVAFVEDSGSAATGGAGGASAEGGTAGSAGAVGVGGAAGSALADAADSPEPTDGANAETDKEATAPACSNGYVDWFQSSFAAADRDVVGSADFPSMPWATTGSLRILGGRLTGTGVASASQGLSFGYEGLRLRYKGRFSDSSQHAKVALNARDDGQSGLTVDLAASGKITLLERDAERGSAALNPIAIDVDWFVEVEFGAKRATVRVTAGNYASLAGSTPLVAIEDAPVDQTSVGKQLAIALTSAGELAASIDELFVARCGLSAPEYQAVFRDAFERADSSDLGNADLPPSSTWSRTTSDVMLGRGALYFFGASFATAPIGSPLVNDGVRLRFSFHGPAALSEFSLLTSYNYLTPNAPSMQIVSGGGTPIELRVGNGSGSSAASIAGLVSHFVQVDIQGDNAVLTLRTVGYAGPILGIAAGTGFSGLPDMAEDILFAANHDISIEEVEIARYAP